jgi:hypothetical protein
MIRKALFFEKKNQKTFTVALVHPAHGCLRLRVTKRVKDFWFFFFKK